MHIILYPFIFYLQKQSIGGFMKRFFKSLRRIDPKIHSFINIKGIKTLPLIIRLNKFKDKTIYKKLLKAGFKIKYDLPFINALTGETPLNRFDSLRNLIEIEKIYYDDKAMLTGWINQNSASENTFPINSLKSSLSGKGITVAFIDSGIYPYGEAARIRRKIIGFKDFINNNQHPYDDNGHGTACLGIVSSLAFNSNIIMAKAFNNSASGYFSDILGSMQWILDIKDKYNIKIAVLPFAYDCYNSDFDIVSLAAEYLWDSGIFLICPSGNKGPSAATISSPGASPKVFTVGAFLEDNNKKIVPQFCSRGPSIKNAKKPDAIMPGFLIPSLPSNINYFGKSNVSAYSKSSILFSGTSAAACNAAAVIALLFEKKKDVTPTDAKNILNLCCTSIGEIRSIQGEGYIDLNKIEEL